MGGNLTDILADLERRGIEIRTDGKRLLLRPVEAVTESLRRRMRKHKAEILVRLQCDKIIRQTLDKVNRACPAGWQPSPADWCRLDEIQLRMDAARDRGDVETLRSHCREYEQTARDIIET